LRVVLDECLEMSLQEIGSDRHLRLLRFWCSLKEITPFSLHFGQAQVSRTTSAGFLSSRIATKVQ
jgi:hypothetical protein